MLICVYVYVSKKERKKGKKDVRPMSSILITLVRTRLISRSNSDAALESVSE